MGEGEARGVWDRGQIMQGFIGNKEEFGFHSRCDGKPLKGVK